MRRMEPLHIARIEFYLNHEYYSAVNVYGASLFFRFIAKYKDYRHLSIFHVVTEKLKALLIEKMKVMRLRLANKRAGQTI